MAIRHNNFVLYVEVTIFPKDRDPASFVDDVVLLIAKKTSDAYEGSRYKIIRPNITNLKRTDDNFNWIMALVNKTSYQLIGFVDVGLNFAKVS